MKRNIGITFIATAIISVYAMELVELTELSKKSSSMNGYGSLTEDTFDIIQEQKKALNESVTSIQTNDNTMLSFLSLHTMCQSFKTMSEDDIRLAIKNLPTHLFKSKKLLLLLSAVMILLPEVTHYICLHMLDGEKDAADLFFTLPFLQAFDLYHEIKKTKMNDNQTIGSLYVKYYDARDLILKAQESPWYSYVPLMPPEDKEKIDLLDADIKNSFLQEQEIFLTDKEFGPGEKLRHCLAMALPKPLCMVVTGVGFASCVFTFVFGLTAAIGGIKIACNPGVVSTAIGASIGGGIVAPFRLCADRDAEEYREQVVSIVPHAEI